MARPRKYAGEILPDGQKRCTKCGEIKSIQDFNVNQYSCRDCQKQFRDKKRLEKIASGEIVLKEVLPYGLKRCSMCKQVKKIDEFVANDTRCKQCCRERAHNRYWENPELARTKANEWRINNYEKAVSSDRKTKEKYRDRYNELGRKRYSENIKKYRERAKKWGEKNKDKRSEYAKQNRERISCINYFFRIGLSVKQIPEDLFSAKILQMNLKRAIKEQTEGHKEVTNG